MIFGVLDRRQLLDLIGKTRSPSGFALESTYSGDRLLSDIRIQNRDQVVVLWADNDSLTTELPMILVPDGTYDDFLAWATTYVGTHVPFTRFLRVQRLSDLDRFPLLDKPKEVISRDEIDSLAGAAIAEAAIQTNFRTSRPGQISLQSCHLTFSFAVLRGLNAGIHPAQVLELAEAWGRARQLTTPRPVTLTSDRAASFWVLGVGALTSDTDVAPAAGTWTATVVDLVRAVRSGASSPSLAVRWGPYDLASSAARDFEDATTLPRERQLRRLDEIAGRLRTSDLPVPLIEALLGYMIARLANGSLDYLNLVSEYKDLPCCGLWFALFATCLDGFDGLVNGNSLGRHVALDARLSPATTGQPVADMSIDELQILRDRKNSRVSNVFNATVDVELLPNVVGRFPNPFRLQDEERTERPTKGTDTLRLSRILREALRIVDQGSDASEKSEPVVGGDLFPEKSSVVKPRTKNSKTNKRR